MTEADLDYVVAIKRAAAAKRFVSEWSREQHEQAMNAPGRLYLIIESAPNGQPVGFILLEAIAQPTRISSSSASSCIHNDKATAGRPFGC
jgi:hypothetical protein